MLFSLEKRYLKELKEKDLPNILKKSSKGTSNDEIFAVLSEKEVDYFPEVIEKSKFPALEENKLYILWDNYHWTGMKLYNKKCFFFDSFGENPFNNDFYTVNYTKFMQATRKLVDDYFFWKCSIQNDYTSTCGLWVILFGMIKNPNKLTKYMHRLKIKTCDQKNDFKSSPNHIEKNKLTQLEKKVNDQIIKNIFEKNV